MGTLPFRLGSRRYSAGGVVVFRSVEYGPQTFDLLAVEQEIAADRAPPENVLMDKSTNGIRGDALSAASSTVRLLDRIVASPHLGKRRVEAKPGRVHRLSVLVGPALALGGPTALRSHAFGSFGESMAYQSMPSGRRLGGRQSGRVLLTWLGRPPTRRRWRIVPRSKVGETLLRQLSSDMIRDTSTVSRPDIESVGGRQCNEIAPHQDLQLVTRPLVA